MRVARLRERGPRAVAGIETSSTRPAALDVSVRASILRSESRWLEAWAVVHPPNVCSVTVLRQVALDLPETHHPEAVQALKQVFVRAMGGASSPYRDELTRVADIAARMPADERSVWLQALRAEFKAKRNFIGGSPAG